MPLSDQNIAASADATLQASGYTELRTIHCDYDVNGHVLPFHGRVSHYYFKRLSQEIVKRVKGVETVVNRIRVES